MKSSLSLLLLAVLVWSCGSGGGDASMNLDATDSVEATSTTSVQGLIQKGPMLQGGTIQAFPLDLALNQGEEVAQALLADDLGSYELPLAEGGPVLLQARGVWFNELTGALSGTPVTLGAVVALEDGANAVNINALTQVCTARTVELARGGMTLAAANVQALDELLAQLGIFTPNTHTALAPQALDLALADPVDHALLAGFSAVLLQAAQHRGGAVDSKVQELLGLLTQDFADGTLDPALVQELAEANEVVDTALFRKRLSTWYAEVPDGPGYQCADPDRVLDADLDGRANASDNCPGDPNPAQTDTDTDTIGDICDSCPITACSGFCLAADGAGRPQDLCHLPCQAGTCPEDQTCLQSEALCGALASCCVPDGEPGGACHDDQTCDGGKSCSPDDPSCPAPLNSCCK